MIKAFIFASCNGLHANLPAEVLNNIKTMTRRYFGIPLLAVGMALVLLLPGCAEEINERENELLGSWTLIRAFQNGSETNRLDGIVLQFTEGMMLSTNFNPALENRLYTYRFKSGQIVAEAEEEQIVFSIEEQTEEDLVLISTLMDFQFRLHFHKDE